MIFFHFFIKLFLNYDVSQALSKRQKSCLSLIPEKNDNLKKFNFLCVLKVYKKKSDTLRYFLLHDKIFILHLEWKISLKSPVLVFFLCYYSYNTSYLQNFSKLWHKYSAFAVIFKKKIRFFFSEDRKKKIFSDQNFLNFRQRSELKLFLFRIFYKLENSVFMQY